MQTVCKLSIALKDSFCGVSIIKDASKYDILTQIYASIENVQKYKDLHIAIHSNPVRVGQKYLKFIYLYLYLFDSMLEHLYLYLIHFQENACIL